MTPVAFLAGFCGVLFGVAVVRLATDDRITPVDAGVTLIVAGVTGLAITWALVDAGSQLAAVHWALSALASVTVIVGVGVIVRFW